MRVHLYFYVSGDKINFGVIVIIAAADTYRLDTVRDHFKCTGSVNGYISIAVIVVVTDADSFGSIAVDSEVALAGEFKLRTHWHVNTGITDLIVLRNIKTKSSIFTDSDSWTAVTACNVYIFQCQIAAVVIHDRNIHLHRLIRITNNSEFTLINVDIGVFFKSEFKKIKFRIISCSIYLLNAVRTDLKISFDDLVLDIRGDAVEE